MRVRGIKRYRHPKTGIVYCYHRATGIRILSEFGTQAFFDELLKLNGQEVRGHVAQKKAETGSLSAVIEYYKTTNAFLTLSERTRKDYERYCDFLQPLWHLPVNAFTAPQIAKLRTKWSKEKGIRAVNYLLAVMSVLMGQAVELGLLKSNPLRDVKKVRKPRDAPLRNRPWELDERRAVLAAAPPHLKLPIVLGMFYGLREGDVLRLSRAVLVDREIKVLTSKRKVPIRLPIFPELLAAAAEHDASLQTRQARQARRRGHQRASDDTRCLCLNSQGMAWTESGFRASFGKMRRKLELKMAIAPGLTFHGLRHTVATVLAEAGVEAETIAAWLGQRSTAMAAHYSREAKRHRLVRAVAASFQPLSPVREPHGDDGE